MKKIYYKIYELIIGRTHPNELRRIFGKPQMSIFNNLPTGYIEE